MEPLEDLTGRLKEERPAEWDALPDIPLYMDQLVAYLDRQLIHFGEGESLTPAMINNYIKAGLLPRANGKKYEREHIAKLTAICALKQVMSVRDLQTMLTSLPAGDTAEDFYDQFCAELDVALRETSESIASPNMNESMALAAMDLALHSYADALACRRIIELIRARSPEGQGRKKK